MGDDAFGIVVEKFLRLFAQRFNLIQKRLVEGKLLQRFFVPLKQLDGVPAKILCRTASLNQVRDGVQNIFQLLTEDKGAGGAALLCASERAACATSLLPSPLTALVWMMGQPSCSDNFLGQSGRHFYAPNPSYLEQ